MRTPQWIKNLSGHAGVLYVGAELAKRGIPVAELPPGFPGDDLIVGRKDGTELCYVAVTSCHPDRSRSFDLRAHDERWTEAPENEVVVFVWLGSPKKAEPPKYWI